MNTELNKKISLAILGQLAAGKTMSEAWDSVMGAGSFDRVVESVYNGLRAKSKNEKNSTCVR